MQAQATATRLSEALAGEPVRPLAPFGWLGKGCFTLMGRVLAQAVPGAQCLLVGPQACLNSIVRTRRFLFHRTVRAGGFAFPRPVHFRTFTTTTEGCALGDDSGLVEAIAALVREERPRLLFVTSTCTTEILGLDVGGILRSLGDTGDTRVFFVQGDHVSTRDEEDAEEDVLSALTDLMEPAGERDPRHANLLGAWFPNTLGELGSMLEAAGFETVTAIPSLCTPESLEAAPRAAWNVVVSHVGDKLASAMEERFGIPPVWAPWPLGAAGSRSWYRLLEARTGARFPGVDRAYDEVRKREEEVGRKVAGVRFALAHLHIGEPFALARYLEDRGMVPHSILCSSVRDEERDDAEVLVERGHDPYVVPPERWSLRRLYADDPPDLFVGFGALARELSVANVPLVDGGLPGFEGTRLFLDYLEAYGAKGTLESGGVRG